MICVFLPDFNFLVDFLISKLVNLSSEYSSGDNWYSWGNSKNQWMILIEYPSDIELNMSMNIIKGFEYGYIKIHSEANSLPSLVLTLVTVSGKVSLKS